jgi:DNA-binding ferritin-like protein
VIVRRNARRTDRMDRMHHAKQAHWHGKGPRCMALHTRCDEVVDATEACMALSAERLVQLRGPPELRRTFAW